MHPIAANAHIDEKTGVIVLRRIYEQKEQILKLTSWEDGLNLSVFDEGLGRWRPHLADPQIPHIGYRLLSLPERGVSAKGWHIPSGIREIISRFYCYQFTILKLFRQEPYAIQMGQSLPALVLLIAEWVSQNSVSPNFLANLFRLRRKEILRHLGLCASRASIKFLARISVGSFTKNDLHNIKAIASCRERIQAFRNIPAIDRTTLFTGRYYPERLQYPFSPECIATPPGSRLDSRKIMQTMNDCLKLGAELGIENRKSLLLKIKTVEALSALHTRWNDRFLERKYSLLYEETTEPVTFPVPPLKGNDNIIPIQTLAELRKEGKDMHHCVGCYWLTILKGESYIYKVLAPERGTLEINPETLELVQFMLAFNKEPGEAAQATVSAWHNEAKAGKAALR